MLAQPLGHFHDVTSAKSSCGRNAEASAAPCLSIHRASCSSSGLNARFPVGLSIKSTQLNIDRQTLPLAYSRDRKLLAGSCRLYSTAVWRWPYPPLARFRRHCRLGKRRFGVELVDDSCFRKEPVDFCHWVMRNTSRLETLASLKGLLFFAGFNVHCCEGEPPLLADPRRLYSTANPQRRIASAASMRAAFITAGSRYTSSTLMRPSLCRVVRTDPPPLTLRLAPPRI